MKIRDLADAENKMHRAMGSQLIYNRQRHQSLFLGVAQMLDVSGDTELAFAKPSPRVTFV